MANDFYNASGAPTAHSAGTSATIRQELAAIALGFDKFPALIANPLKLIRVNASGTALEIDPAAYLPLTGGTLTGALIASGYSISAGNFFINGQATTDAGTVGFTGSNGPGVVFWGSGTAGVGAFEVYTAGVKRLGIGSTGATTMTTSGLIGTLALIDTGSNGVNFKLTGNGATTPNKYVRVLNGNLEFVNTGYTAVIASLTDAGTFSANAFVGPLTGAVTGHASLDLALTGGTMTGLINSSVVGAEALRINNNGAFISGYTASGSARNGYLQFNTGGSVQLTAENGNDLLVNTAGGSMVITAAGKAVFSSSVGIGTGGQAVIGALNIRQDSGDGPMLVLENRVVNGSSHKYGSLIFSPYRDVADPVYGAAIWSEGGSAAGYNAELVFGTSVNNSASTFPTAQMRIDGTGNVGIGTVPSFKLHVAGNAQASNWGVGTNATTDAGSFGLWNGNGGAISMYGSAAAGAPGAIIFNRSGGESARFDSSGNFGIGVTPTTKLDVFGTYMALRNGVYTGYIGSGTLMTGGGTGDLVVRSDLGDILLGSATIRMRVSSAGVIDITAGSGKLTMAGSPTRTVVSGGAPQNNNFGVSVAHGGPARPADSVCCVLLCNTAEAGYSIGDEVEVASSTVDDSNTWSNSTNVGLSYNRTGTMVIGVKTTGVRVGITNANWTIYFKCLWF